MYIPACFNGRYIGVKKVMDRAVERVITGASFREALVSRTLVDTSLVTSAYLILQTHRDISIVESHFHLTLVAQALIAQTGHLGSPEAERIFSELLEFPWGVLVFADPADNWFGSNLITGFDHRRQPYLKALLRHARALSAEGRRFIGPSGKLGSFWEVNGIVRPLLEQEGLHPGQFSGTLGEQQFSLLCRKMSQTAGA